MSVTAFAHPYLSGLFGDDEISKLLGAEADIRAMLSFEQALAKAQASLDIIPQDAAAAIASTAQSFRPDIDALKAGVATDGVVVANLVKQLRAALPPQAASYLHVGATSQDVIDTSLMLRLKAIVPVYIKRLSSLVDALGLLHQRFGARQLMGYTRMQAAIPITVSDRVQSWQAPLGRSLDRLTALNAAGFPLQFGGAAGSLDKFGTQGPELRSALASELDLVDWPQWQSQRDFMAEFASLLSLITGSLGKFGQDVALMAELGGEIAMSGGGGSSAMAHKQNPVGAEVLVTLARFNAVQLSGMHHSLVHEQERSGAAWSLEWLILPQMLIATGAALRLGLNLAGSITSLGRD